jgi:cytoskeletal protein RodZ
MAGKHSKKKSKKPLVIALISVLVVAVIAACVVIAFFTDFSFDSQTSTTNQTTAATSQTTENTTAIPQTSVTELTDNTTQSSAQEETTSQSNSDDDTSKENEAVVSPVQNDDADYFEATYSPYKAVDSSTGNECSLKEVFGSSYSGGSITFENDGSFSDTLSLSSANSGVYALSSGSIIATYTNDKNVSITVTNWENGTPTEIIINYGGYDVYFS